MSLSPVEIVEILTIGKEQDTYFEPVKLEVFAKYP